MRREWERGREGERERGRGGEWEKTADNQVLPLWITDSPRLPEDYFPSCCLTILAIYFPSISNSIFTTVPGFI